MEEHRIVDITILYNCFPVLAVGPTHLRINCDISANLCVSCTRPFLNQHTNLPISAHIDSICDEFEQRWLAGEAPQIETYLENASDSIPTNSLLTELLSVELDCRNENGESPQPEDYFARFPDCTALIIDLFQRYSAPKDFENDTTLSIGGSFSSLAEEPAADSTLNRSNVDYQVGSVIAKGGMGAIYVAEDPRICRRVALKVVHPGKDSSDSLARFVREAQITGQLEHPSIVPVHDLGVGSDGKVFYTMKFIHGKTLKDVLSQIRDGDSTSIKAFRLSRLLTIFTRVCDAIEFAHSKGVIHRDLKPENIMIGDYGEVLVVDWGLAKVLETESDSVASNSYRVHLGTPQLIESETFDCTDGSTIDGTVMGTPAYMSPEQACGDIRQLDERTDIYALGATLYNMLTLHPPVQANDLHTLLRKVQQGEIDAISRYETEGPVGKIPSALQLVCMKALSRRAHERYSTVAELRQEIESYLAGFATRVESAGPLRQLILFIQRHKAVSAATLVALSLLLVLSIGGPVVAIRQAKLTSDARAAKAAANAASDLANQSRETAERRKEELRNQLYHFEMIAASSEALRPSGSPKIGRWIPSHEGEADLRGWEWYFAFSSRERPKAIFKTNGNRTAFCWSEDGNRLVIADGDKFLTDWDVETGRVLRQWEFKGKKDSVRLMSNLNQVIFDSRKIFSLKTRQSIYDIKIPGNVGFGVSPDSRHWAYAQEFRKPHRCKIHFLSKVSGAPSASVEHFGLPLGAMDWSHDGNRLACGANPYDWIRIYDRAGKRLAERSVTGRTINAMNRIVWSRDDSRIATTDKDSIYVLNSHNLKSVGANSIPHGSEIYSVDLAPDATHVVSAGADRMVRVFEIESGEQIGVFRGHKERIRHVKWSPNGKWIASCGGGVIRVWSVTTGVEQRRSIERIPSAQLATLEGVSTAHWHPTQNCIALQGPWKEGYSSVVMDLQSKKALFEQPYGRSLCWEPSGNGIATARMGGGANDLIQLRDGDFESRWETQRICDHIVWSTDGQRFFTVEDHGKTQVMYDVRSRKELWRTKYHVQVGSFRRIKFSPNAREFFLSTSPRDLKILNVKDGKIRVALRGHGDTVTAADWRWDSKQIATSSRDHTIRIWDVASGATVRTLVGHGGIVCDIRWSPDGSRIATVSNDGTARLWDSETGAETARFKDLSGYGQTVDWSQDGMRVAFGGSEGLLVLDASNGTRRSAIGEINALIKNDAWDAARERIESCLPCLKTNGEFSTINAGWWQYLGDESSFVQSGLKNTNFADANVWKRTIDVTENEFDTHRIAMSGDKPTVLSATRIFSESDQELTLCAYGRGRITIWKGGTEFMSCGNDEFPFRGALKSITLSKGWNTLFVMHSDRKAFDPLQITLVNSVGFDEPRTWNLDDGKSKVNASILKVEDGKVYLERVDNEKTIAIPATRFSEDEQMLFGKLVASGKRERDALIAKWAQEVLLGAKFGGQGLVCSRWLKSPTLTVFGADPRQTKVVEETLSEIGEVLSETSIKRIVRKKPGKSSADIQVFFAPLAKFSELATKHGFRLPNGNLGYTYITWNDNHEIVKAVVLLASDKLEGEKLKHFALEQLIRSLGLLNDSAQFEDSVSYSGPVGNGKAVHLSELDKDLLRFFYRNVTPGMRQKSLHVAIKTHWLRNLKVEPIAPEPEWGRPLVRYLRRGHKWETAEVPKHPLPRRLNDLAMGEWISLFDEPGDIQSIRNLNPLLHKWSDGVVTLTSMDVEESPTSVSVLEQPRQGSRVILRVQLKHERGDHAGIALIHSRKGKGRETIKLARKRGFYQIELADNHFRTDHSTPRSSGFEDFALVRYDDQIAVYEDGLKTMDFVRTPEMETFFLKNTPVIPQLSIFDSKHRAQSKFKDIQLMILK